MRTFIALDLPPDFADDAAALARRLSASMEGRFLKRDTYHLTLAFLGDVDEAQLAAATDALEAACAGASPVPLRSDGLGKFGRATDATLWLGIAAAPELEQLAARLRDELRARDVPFDAKPFKAHLTLARRVLSRAEPGALLGSAVACPVRDIRLMLSERPGGRLTYTELFRAPFPR